MIEIDDFLARHPSWSWAWDDEDTATDPYIQIYSDGGTVVSLHYKSQEEREACAEFAHFVCALARGALGGSTSQA